MKKTVLPLIAVIAIVLLVVVFRSGRPDLKQYVSLSDPGITNLSPQKMLTIELKGDPNQTSGEAFGQLYRTYFKLKSKHKSFKPVAPRARWTGNPAVRASWTGVFGLPVADDVTGLPAGTDPRLRIETWAYGATAQILHKGAYTNEQPTVDRLRAFIKEKGYRIVGEHEEEYLTMPSSDSSRFFTVIRYRVEKTGQ